MNKLLIRLFLKTLNSLKFLKLVDLDVSIEVCILEKASNNINLENYSYIYNSNICCSADRK